MSGLCTSTAECFRTHGSREKARITFSSTCTHPSSRQASHGLSTRTSGQQRPLLVEEGACAVVAGGV